MALEERASDCNNYPDTARRCAMLYFITLHGLSEYDECINVRTSYFVALCDLASSHLVPRPIAVYSPTAHNAIWYNLRSHDGSPHTWHDVTCCQDRLPASTGNIFPQVFQDGIATYWPTSSTTQHGMPILDIHHQARNALPHNI